MWLAKPEFKDRALIDIVQLRLTPEVHRLLLPQDWKNWSCWKGRTRYFILDRKRHGDHAAFEEVLGVDGGEDPGPND